MVDRRAEPTQPAARAARPAKLSDELEAWLKGPGDKTLRSLVELFAKKSFALLFVLLLGVPALPLPTGGATFTNVVFALLVIGGSLGAFLAPPFTGLDTLPALGVVLLSLGVLLEDIAVVIAGVAVGIAGVALEIVVGSAAIKGLGSLL